MKLFSKFPRERNRFVTLFLCGDVMTGRGIDQILPCPGDSTIHESYMLSAFGYVELAETVHGDIPWPVDFSYIWGDALKIFEQMTPDVKIINLETAITRSDEYWKGKGINYRMNPGNIPCLTAAGIDCCSLANNHVLDWGYDGLLETVETLKKVRIKSAGAGRDMAEAAAPAIHDISGKGRVIVFSFGTVTSGIPCAWKAAPNKPGINLLPDLSEETVRAVGDQVRSVKQAGDIVVASIHWGGNWGYAIPGEHREFACTLIDEAGVDVIHGHSSHHVLGIEVYHEKLILYGCGDFINDYEGISGHEQYRGDIGLMYFPDVDPWSGRLVRLHMVPTQVYRFRIRLAQPADVLWIYDVLNREGKLLGTSVSIGENNIMTLQQKPEPGE